MFISAYQLFLICITVLLLTIMQVKADPILKRDLASTSAWTCKGEKDNDWSVIEIPGQRKVNRDQKWIDFQRSITIPSVSTEQSTILRFQSINDGGIIFIDNIPVDTVKYSLFPVNVDLTHFVKPGIKYILTVRCLSRTNYYGGKGYFPNGNNPGGMLGIPRGISMEVYEKVHIVEGFVRPSVANNNFYYDVWISNNASTATIVKIKGRLRPWNKGDIWNYPILSDTLVSISANTTKKITRGPFVWNLGAASYWWPNIPFKEKYLAKLHFLDLSLNIGEKKIDSLNLRFGFSEYTEGPYFYKINGVHIFQIGDGTQETHFGSFQTGYLTTEGWGAGPKGAKETWRRYMRIGMNSFRFHNSAATEIMNDAADEVGFMTIPESAIRGEGRSMNEEWHDVYKPEAIKAMLRFYRNHPSVVRYSLDNEWEQLTKNEKYCKILIDAAMNEDPRRPLSFSQDKGPWDTQFTGSNGIGSAWVMSHYRTPPNDTITIKGIEEMFWPYKNFERKNELVDCARAGILYRLHHYAVFHPWTWNNYWCNFVEGSSLAAKTHRTSWGRKDRIDNVDGWGSDIVRFVQNCYHVFASADLDIIENKINDNEAMIFPDSTAYSFVNVKSTIRRMVMFNNSLSAHKMRIGWEIYLDRPNGVKIASGWTPKINLEPGSFTQPLIELPLPSTKSAFRKLYFVISTEVDGRIEFSENRYFFNVMNP